MKNLPSLRPPEDVFSTEGKEQEEAPEGEDLVSTVQQGGDGENDSPEDDLDNASSVHFAI